LSIIQFKSYIKTEWINMYECENLFTAQWVHGSACECWPWSPRSSVRIQLEFFYHVNFFKINSKYYKKKKLKVYSSIVYVLIITISIECPWSDANSDCSLVAKWLRSQNRFYFSGLDWANVGQHVSSSAASELHLIVCGPWLSWLACHLCKSKGCKA
jgi:hypothetical protein